MMMALYGVWVIEYSVAAVGVQLWNLNYVKLLFQNQRVEIIIIFAVKDIFFG